MQRDGLELRQAQFIFYDNPRVDFFFRPLHAAGIADPDDRWILRIERDSVLIVMNVEEIIARVADVRPIRAAVGGCEAA